MLSLWSGSVVSLTLQDSADSGSVDTVSFCDQARVADSFGISSDRLNSLKRQVPGRTTRLPALTWDAPFSTLHPVDRGGADSIRAGDSRHRLTIVEPVQDHRDICLGEFGTSIPTAGFGESDCPNGLRCPLGTKRCICSRVRIEYPRLLPEKIHPELLASEETDRSLNFFDHLEVECSTTELSPCCADSGMRTSALLELFKVLEQSSSDIHARSDVSTPAVAVDDRVDASPSAGDGYFGMHRGPACFRAHPQLRGNRGRKAQNIGAGRAFEFNARRILTGHRGTSTSSVRPRSGVASTAGVSCVDYTIRRLWNEAQRRAGTGLEGLLSARQVERDG